MQSMRDDPGRLPRDVGRVGQELGLAPCRLRHPGLLPCVGGSPDRKVPEYGRRARHKVAEYFVAALVSGLPGA